MGFPAFWTLITTYLYFSLLTHHYIYLKTASTLICFTGAFAIWLVLPEFELHKGRDISGVSPCYKAFLILFNIKESPQSITIAKVDFGAIFKMAASENRIYLILIFNHHREAKLVSKPTFTRSRNTAGTLFGQ